MSASTGRACAKWRRKRLDENAREFRAKEALRMRNYRARAKEKQRHALRTRMEEGSRVQDENELSDDVDALSYDAVDGHCRTRHSERSLHFSSTPPSQSSSGSENLPNDDEPFLDSLLFDNGYLSRRS